MAPSPVKFESARDYSCSKRWPVLLAIFSTFVLGFVLLFATPTNVVECSYLEEYCSRRGTKETPKLSYLIPAIILLVSSVLLMIIYCRLHKEDKKHFKEAHRLNRLQQRQDFTSPKTATSESAKEFGGIEAGDTSFPVSEFSPPEWTSPEMSTELGDNKADRDQAHPSKGKSPMQRKGFPKIQLKSPIRPIIIEESEFDC